MNADQVRWILGKLERIGDKIEEQTETLKEAVGLLKKLDKKEKKDGHGTS